MDRRITGLVVAGQLALVLCAWWSEGAALAQGLVPYNNPANRYALQVPFGWEQRMVGQSLLWLSPQEGPGDQFRENVNITLEALNQPMSLQQYASASIQSMGQLLQGFVLLEQGQTVLNGQPAYWMVYNHYMGQPLQVLVYFIVRGNMAYILTCTAQPAQFARWRPLFMQIGTTLTVY